MLDRRATMKRICRGCGCTDTHACMTDDGPCSWVLLDIAKASGICSACADHVEWDMQIMGTHGLEREPAPARVAP